MPSFEEMMELAFRNLQRFAYVSSAIGILRAHLARPVFSHLSCGKRLARLLFFTVSCEAAWRGAYGILLRDPASPAEVLLAAIEELLPFLHPPSSLAPFPHVRKWIRAFEASEPSVNIVVCFLCFG